MNKFLKNILLFLFILVSLNAIIYIYVHDWYYEVYNNYDVNSKSFLFADSHGLSLSNKLKTDKDVIYNFSHGSDSYYDINRKLKKIIRSSPNNVKRVIISVDDHALSTYRDKMNNIDRSVFFTDKHEYESFYEYIKLKYLKYYVVFFNHKIRDLIILKLFYDNDKSEKEWEQMDDSLKNIKAKNRVDLQFTNNVFSQKLHDELYSILYLCDKYNIQLIGIKFPLTKSYLEQANGFSYHADSILYNSGKVVLDYKILFSQCDSCFSNEDHMNDYGATILSKHIVKDLNAIAF